MVRNGQQISGLRDIPLLELAAWAALMVSNDKDQN
jgi:hypothetical protein